MKVSSRSKVVLNATLFNLLFEYSLRGVNSLLNQPLLPFILFLAYYAYFNIVNDLIQRYRLRDYHLVVIGFIYGNITSIILPGGVFSQPTYLGINWENLVFINIIWWGIIQGILTFYIATRITYRDFNGQLLSKRGWTLSIITLSITLTILRKGIRKIPTIESAGLMTLLVLTILSIIYLRRLIEYNNHPVSSYKPSRFMDMLSALTTMVFILSAIFLAYNPALISIHYINQPALRFISFYTILIALLIILYRISTGNEIPI